MIPLPGRTILCLTLISPQSEPMYGRYIYINMPILPPSLSKKCECNWLCIHDLLISINFQAYCFSGYSRLIYFTSIPLDPQPSSLPKSVCISRSVDVDMYAQNQLRQTWIFQTMLLIRTIFPALVELVEITIPPVGSSLGWICYLE